MSEWKIPENKRKELVELLKNFFNKFKNISNDEFENLKNNELELNLYGLGFCPYWIKTVLEEDFEYEVIDTDRNGWEMDFWIYLDTVNDDYPSNIYICGCGMTFELKVCLDVD